MTLLTSWLPAAWRPHAKTLVALAGLVLGVVIVSVEHLPNWLVIVTKVLTVAGVHTTPNVDLDGDGIPDVIDPDAPPRVTSCGGVTTTRYEDLP
ncbi:MAG: hypothetical protein FWF90_17390 [Promicromonosporaceae bacterium]|nr:hypothetical protein [Promicromonosporaceae bacterium]